jgi:DNA-binding IclR family transcriptional regulator
MLRSAAGSLAAAYLPDELTTDLIERDMIERGTPGDAAAFIGEARAQILPRGYALFTHEQPRHHALAAPVWTADDRLAFILSIVANRPSDEDPANFTEALLDSAGRASMLIGATGATGPRSPFRARAVASA